MITRERISELRKIWPRDMQSAELDEVLDAAAEALELADGLECAIRAAWDGPAEWVGTGCGESYSQWRTRMEKTARDALALVRK